MRFSTLLALLLVLAVAPAARAKSFHVSSSFAAGCDGSGNCKTIGAAVTAARSTGGVDTIAIAAGTYDEALVFNSAADAGDVLEGAMRRDQSSLHPSPRRQRPRAPLQSTVRSRGLRLTT